MRYIKTESTFVCIAHCPPYKAVRCKESIAIIGRDGFSRNIYFIDPYNNNIICCPDSNIYIKKYSTL